VGLITAPEHQIQMCLNSPMTRSVETKASLS
jgi:hypothetical protein